MSLILAVSSCEKQDTLIDDLAIDQDLKAAPIVLDQGTIDQINYLYSLIAEIETLVEDGQLNPGNANSLIVKIENSIKSLEKGNDNAAENQLSAFINQVEDYVINGVMTAEIAEELMSSAETAIILSNGFFIDPRDGNEYRVVLIGDQLWMAENLKFLPEVSPTYLKSDLDPSFYVYGYEGTDVNEAKNTVNYNTYGVLYNWPAAMESTPEGWHLPSDTEWELFAQYISDQKGPYTRNEYEWSELGKHLKAKGFLYLSNDDYLSNGLWIYYENTSEGTDDFGFSGLPGGSFDSSSPFFGINSRAVWWSATWPYNRVLVWSDNDLHVWGNAAWVGNSVRCIRD